MRFQDLFYKKVLLTNYSSSLKISSTYCFMSSSIADFSLEAFYLLFLKDSPIGIKSFTTSISRDSVICERVFSSG